MTAKVSWCNVHVHLITCSVTKAGRDQTLFTDYSPVHKYTTLLPTVMMVIQVYSGVFKAVLYVDERAYEQLCNKLWHRSVYCGVSHTIYTDC